LDDNNENRKKENDHAERYLEEGDEIEEGEHLQEDQREGSQELHDTGDRERMQ
jgi:hypothetical protein